MRPDAEAVATAVTSLLPSQAPILPNGVRMPIIPRQKPPTVAARVLSEKATLPSFGSCCGVKLAFAEVWELRFCPPQPTASSLPVLPSERVTLSSTRPVLAGL